MSGGWEWVSALANVSRFYDLRSLDNRLCQGRGVSYCILMVAPKRIIVDLCTQ